MIRWFKKNKVSNFYKKSLYPTTEVVGIEISKHDIQYRAEKARKQQTIEIINLSSKLLQLLEKQLF